ncbi:MAG: sigma-70 family RNA polymerase sigma factor [Phyllobacteriaceae bacterium]|nr:sigma-70 family RNA polymerase sigma factor [Phyllobacteriaceae bacterium]
MTVAEDRALLPDAAALAACAVASAVSRDRQSFAVLYRHFAPRVKSYALRLGAPIAEAEEIAQETLLAVWRKAGLFDAAKAGASTWIFTIARNLFIDRRRNARRSGEVADAALSAEPVDPATPDTALQADERERRVRDAIARLSPEQQAVIRLSYFSETPQTQIADTLGIPLGTVKSRVRLAAEKLRQYLEDCR